MYILFQLPVEEQWLLDHWAGTVEAKDSLLLVKGNLLTYIDDNSHATQTAGAVCQFRKYFK